MPVEAVHRGVETLSGGGEVLQQVAAAATASRADAARNPQGSARRPLRGLDCRMCAASTAACPADLISPGLGSFGFGAFDDMSPRCRTPYPLSRGLARQPGPPSGMQVPLADIVGQGVVDVDFESADQRAGIRRGAHDALVENRGGVDLVAGPGRLPGPPAAGCGRIPDDAIGCGPLATSMPP